MKFKLISVLVVFFGMLTTFSSCKDEGEEGNETMISHYNDTESHNVGQNCMVCHVSGGSGEGWFTVAGTVYDSNEISLKPNSTIKLFTGINGTGTLKATIEVDGNGNFYTSTAVSFGDGLYTSVTSPSGNQKHMSSKVTTGQCASCHGVSTKKIWVN